MGMMNENNINKTKLSKYTELLETSEKNFSEQEKQFKVFQKSTEEKENELNHKIMILSTELEESKTSCTKLCTQRDDLNTENNKLTNKCSDLLKKSAENEKIVKEEFASKIKSKDQIIHELEINQIHLKKSQESLELECISLRKELQDSRFERNDISERLNEAETALTVTTFEKDTVITQLTTKLETAERKMNESLDEFEKLRSDSNEKIRLSVKSKAVPGKLIC